MRYRFKKVQLVRFENKCRNILNFKAKSGSKKVQKWRFEKMCKNANKNVMWAEKAGSKNIDEIKTTINN